MNCYITIYTHKTACRNWWNSTNICANNIGMYKCQSPSFDNIPWSDIIIGKIWVMSMWKQTISQFTMSIKLIQNRNLQKKFRESSKIYRAEKHRLTKISTMIYLLRIERKSQTPFSPRMITNVHLSTSVN